MVTLPALAVKQDQTVDDVYDSADEQRRLKDLVDARYASMLLAVHELVRVAFDLDARHWQLDDAATRAILADAAQRVVRIDETTRQGIAEMLQRGQAMGLSDWELANGSRAHDYPGIQGLFTETWAGRPLLVARTELAEAQVLSAQNRYQASGLVSHMRVHDGTLDAPCAARNGTTVPVTERVSTLHPRCTVSLSPVLREGVA